MVSQSLMAGTWTESADPFLCGRENSNICKRTCGCHLSHCTFAAATGEGGARARGTDAIDCLQGLQALQAAGLGGGADAPDQAATGALIAASPPMDAGAGGPHAAPNLALRPLRAPALARWRGVLRELLGRSNPAGARQLGTILV